MAGLLAAFFLVGCMRLRPAPAPLRIVSYPGSGEANTLVVLLPGRRDRPEDFGRFGFPQLAARSGAQVDMLAVDAHMGYYYRRTLVDRLREDVIGPARQRYARVWLVGISIGGTGALLYTDQYPEDVDGIVLLAPFLGEKEVIAEVAAAGSLAAWQAPQPLDPEDFQRRLWVWLQGFTRGKGPKIPLYLGYGTEDAFSQANSLLARELPPEKVFTVRGGHDWKAWKTLWEAFVRTGALH